MGTPALSRGVDPRSIMNLFFLHLLTNICAQSHFDKHVLKMILEVAQLLSTAHHMLAPAAAAVHLEQKRIYRKTHHNHPCARWVRSHKANYVWACDLGLALCEEYTHRYEKEHKTKSVLTFCPTMCRPALPRLPFRQRRKSERAESAHSAGHARDLSR